MLIGIDGNEANVRSRVGSNQYSFEILWGLYLLSRKRDFDFLIYLKEAPLADLPPEKSRWQYRRIGPSRFWTRFALPLELTFRRPRPAVFFSPGHYSPWFLPMPLVVSIMDLGYLRFPKQFRRRDLYQLTSWTESSIRKARRVLAISRFTRNDIIKTYRLEPEKVVVTPLGYKKIRIKNYKLQIERIRRKYRIRGDYILFLGTLKPSKNIEGLIEAFARLDLAGNNLKLVIAGKKGWFFKDIYERVKTLSLEKRVIFTDFVPEKEAPILLAGALVFVLPSFWEGFGLPALQSMSLGTPVVVSRVASLPEVVGPAGILVNPQKPDDIARGIKKAFKERKKRSRLGLLQAKNFSWEKCARRTLAVLETVGQE
ncbi:MAG: glycosyltransferase family 4 protein [Candidatus Pacebacteria bacterium]|nr:glycosyltransferase family 4 protein [Candidatus Paceibacterota bacterium]